MNDAGEALVFFSRLKIGHNRLAFLPEDEMQPIRVALPAHKTTLIIARIIQFHLVCYPVVFSVSTGIVLCNLNVPYSEEKRQQQSHLSVLSGPVVPVLQLGDVGWLLRPRQRVEAEGPDNPQDAEDNGVDADHPDEAKRGCHRAEEQNRGKQQREQPGDNQQDFAPGGLVIGEGNDKVEDARQNSPDGDQIKQDQRGNAGPEEGDDADDNADQPTYEQPAPVIVSALADSCNDRENAIYQRKGAKERDKHNHGNTRPDQGRYAKENCDDAANEQRPPVAPIHLFCHHVHNTSSLKTTERSAIWNLREVLPIRKVIVDGVYQRSCFYSIILKSPVFGFYIF